MPTHGEATSAMLPATGDILFSLVPLVVYLVSVLWVVVVEVKRGWKWAVSLPWCVITIVLPLLGFVVWAIWNYAMRPAHIQARR